MTQPPLSYGIQELEADLGVRLFERTTRSTTITPAGRLLLEDARRVLAAAQQIYVTAAAAAQ
ncbi:HTH-type transcriptional regulator TfdS [compost metagenome]